MANHTIVLTREAIEQIVEEASNADNWTFRNPDMAYCALEPHVVRKLCNMALASLSSDREEKVTDALRELMDAAYTAITESNGISDNEWKVGDQIVTNEFPVGSFVQAMENLDRARIHARNVLALSPPRRHRYE